MQYSYCKILIGCLVLQVVVDATVDVLTQGFLPRPATPVNLVVASFFSRYATIINSNIEGQLEYAAPSDACAPIAHPFFVPDYYRRNLVLINGTDKCDFWTKIKYAQEVGFEAAILFDPFPEPFNYSNITFPIKRSEINISVVLVSCEDGIKLLNYIFPVSRKQDVWVMIKPTSTSYLGLIIFLALVFGIPFAAALVLLLVKVIRRNLSGYRKI